MKHSGMDFFLFFNPAVGFIDTKAYSLIHESQMNQDQCITCMLFNKVHAKIIF